MTLRSTESRLLPFCLRLGQKADLDGLGVNVQNILQSPLDSVKAKATPTLLIVDKTGTINKAWVGKLESQREKQVIASLQ
jgi:hypothetical protein